MAQLKFSNEQGEFTIKHRAVCEDDTFKGPWRTTLDAATLDAAAHRSEPGNQDHVIRVVTQQTLSVVFNG